jgi:FdhE protein
LNESTTHQSSEAAAARILGALDAIGEELRPLENVLAAFKELFIEKARLKAELPPFAAEPIQPPDPIRFEQGVPLASESFLVDFPKELWEIAARRLIPAMEIGFPKLGEALSTVKRAILDGRLDPQAYMKAHVQAGAQGEEPTMAASSFDIAPRAIQFILGQIMKPLVEKKAEALMPLIAGLRWHKGYCPVCGSMPELAFLKEQEGQRWLRCSTCAQHWRYVRLACPFCENEEQDKLELYYIAGREGERAEVCHHCGRYVLCMDLRDRFDESVLDVAAIGLIHLDLLAQQKGFAPAAVCAWNIVADADVEPFPAAAGPAVQ